MALPTDTLPPDLLANALLECTGQMLSPEQDDWNVRSAELLREVLGNEELNAKFQGALDELVGPVRTVEPWNYKRRRIHLRALQPEQDHNDFLYQDCAMGSGSFSCFPMCAVEHDQADWGEDFAVKSALLKGWYDGLASPRLIGFDHQSALEEPAFHALEALVRRTHEIVRSFREHRLSNISSLWNSLFHPKDDWVVVMRPRALNCSSVEAECGEEKIEIVSVISGEDLFLRIWQNSKTRDHHLKLADLEASVNEMREVIETTGSAAVTLDRALTFYGAQSTGGSSNLDRHMLESVGVCRIIRY